ncbi:MAG: excinuclease ABC subunit UvrC [Deltaproteobacteria bacterium]|nr:MAG: excinuclease ABC subunit UvrC [Deltaproteobacteria bacterium]
MTDLQDNLSRVSSAPGVYLMKDSLGNILYSGKAQNLKKRLASYFGKTGISDIKTSVLIDKIFNFETIITASEKEALILESNLIKRYKPRYNVVLKDDKRYPSLRLDVEHPYPKLSIVRKIKKDGALYFGPYSSAQAVRETLKIINKTFKLRKCSDREFKTRTRPCLNCQMQGCLAPCCREVDKKIYDEMVKEVVLFLKGRTPELIRKVKKDMVVAAEAQDFERAAVLRDKMFSLERTVEKQVAVSTDFKDRDVIAIARSSEIFVVTIFYVRGGFLLGTRNFYFSETMSNDEEILGVFIRQYYEKAHFIPKEILLSKRLEDSGLIEEWLRNLKGEKVVILRPHRGEKASLLNMAVQNAEKSLKDKLSAIAGELETLTRLQKRLNLARLPMRIECFDNSNLSGTEPVAGMVVFENGKSKKSAYRKYKIKTVIQPDDYAYMDEVLRRRYGKGEKSKPFPDLLMVDGGKGQLNIAVAVIKNLNLEKEFEIIGIAKKDIKKGEDQDKIYKPGRVNPINFGHEGNLLLFLQKIRDETHRFAIAFQRKRRKMKSLRSALDEVPGIGKKRKETLLTHFESIKGIRSATLEELSTVPGINRRIAAIIKKQLSLSG